MSILRAVTTTVFGFALMSVDSHRAQKPTIGTGKPKSLSAARWKFRESTSRGGRYYRPAPTSSRFWTHSPTATSCRSSAQDEKTVYATILAIPNYRLKATGKTVVTFRERPAGEPEALPGLVLPWQKLGRGICLSEGEGDRVGENNQDTDPF